jgi:hypothetical protein
MSGRFASYSPPMPADPDDWRRQGQEEDLSPGTVFPRHDYRALDEHQAQVQSAYSEAARVVDTAVFLGFHCLDPAPTRKDSASRRSRDC